MEQNVKKFLHTETIQSKAKLGCVFILFPLYLYADGFPVLGIHLFILLSWQ